MSKAKAIEQLEHIRTLCGLELVDGNPGNQLAMECRMAATKAVRALGSEHDELGVAAAEPSAGPSAVSPSQTTEDAAAVPNAAWVHIQERLPVDGEVVVAGHVAGWIERDVLFADGGFRKRHNANTGGKAGYQQKDWKKPDGTPASPNDWPFGHTCFPTHWQPYPAVPNMPVPEARRTPSWEKPVLGYFRKGGTKWMLVQVDGNSLTGYDIAPGGGVHTLHIARESVDAFVLINKD